MVAEDKQDGEDCTNYCTVLVVGLIVSFIGGYLFNWTWVGVGPYNPPTSDFQRGVTLYNWFQLAIIPAALAFGVWWLNRLQQQRDQKLADQHAQAERDAAEKRAQIERDIALDNQRGAALKEYIDKISELLLHENLRKSTQEDEASMMARVQTLTVLTRLDSGRKRTVLEFLHESMLIFKKAGIIDLHGADLSRAELSELQLWDVALPDVNLKEANLSRAYLGSASLIGANLIGADLSEAYLAKANLAEANLSGANLRGADFGELIVLVGNRSEDDLNDAILIVSDADLSDADLTGAKVTDEQLAKAKSLKGATMPDGSIHP